MPPPASALRSPAPPPAPGCSPAPPAPRAPLGHPQIQNPLTPGRAQHRGAGQSHRGPTYLPLPKAAPRPSAESPPRATCPIAWPSAPLWVSRPTPIATTSPSRNSTTQSLNPSRRQTPPPAPPRTPRRLPPLRRRAGRDHGDADPTARLPHRCSTAANAPGPNRRQANCSRLRRRGAGDLRDESDQSTKSSSAPLPPEPRTSPGCVEAWRR